MKTMTHTGKAHSTSTKLTHQETQNGKMAINQTVGAMGNPRWSLGFSWLPDKPQFYLIG